MLKYPSLEMQTLDKVAASEGVWLLVGMLI